ncbi:MAG: flagellar filament capping protein FliD [Gammaproteobacteria bacterium]|nr:flagellar filament capping protein FliD [Gammaproteobacteria bacterium]
MAAITSAGVGSGIDVESLITSLMEAERAPLDTYESKKQTISVQLSAFGQLKSQLSALQDIATTLGDTSKFGEFVATTSNEEIFTATSTSGTIAEQHDINVLSLAQNHRLASDSFTDSSASVGAGTYSFSSGSESFDVTLEAGADSLKHLRDAINDAAGNTSISASIINVDGGSRLVLTAKDGGTANAITAPAMFSELTAAVDATFEVDGFLTTSSSNTVTDVIPGVTLELKDVGSGKLSTSRDMENLRASLDEFVSKFNEISSNISTLSENTLQGDSLPRSIISKLRQEFFTTVETADGSTLSAYDLGFTFDKEGVLSLDEDKFEEISSTDLENYVAAFTTQETGFAQRIKDTISTYTQAGGLIDNRTEGLDNRTSTINDQIERFEYRLEQIEARYRAQFTAMDEMVAQLQASSDYMTSQLSSLSSS